MSTTWSGTLQIKEQIQALADDGTFESSGSYVNLLLPWANGIVNEIAHEVVMPHLLTNGQATVTTDNHVWDLPSDFMRLSEEITKVRVSDTYIDIIPLKDLHELNPSHDDSTDSGYPDYCAIAGGYIYFYPLWAGTFVIEDYYRFPTAMTDAGNVPDIPNDAMRTELIVTGVCGKHCFLYTGELEQAKLYYDRSTYPHSGRFFELLEIYRLYCEGLKTGRHDYASYY